MKKQIFMEAGFIPVNPESFTLEEIQEHYQDIKILSVVYRPEAIGENDEVLLAGYLITYIPSINLKPGINVITGSKEYCKMFLQGISKETNTTIIDCSNLDIVEVEDLEILGAVRLLVTEGFVEFSDMNPNQKNLANLLLKIKNSTNLVLVDNIDSIGLSEETLAELLNIIKSLTNLMIIIATESEVIFENFKHNLIDFNQL